MGPGGSQLFILLGKAERVAFLGLSVLSQAVPRCMWKLTFVSGPWNQQTLWQGLDRKWWLVSLVTETPYRLITWTQEIRDEPEPGPQREPQVCDGEHKMPAHHWVGRQNHPDPVSPSRCEKHCDRANLQAEPFSLEVPGTSGLPSQMKLEDCLHLCPANRNKIFATI